MSGSTTIAFAKCHHGEPSQRQTMVVSQAPTYESSSIAPARERPLQSVTVIRRSMPTWSNAGTPRPVQRLKPDTSAARMTTTQGT
jgi:hypothetical protein